MINPRIEDLILVNDGVSASSRSPFGHGILIEIVVLGRVDSSDGPMKKIR